MRISTKGDTTGRNQTDTRALMTTIAEVKTALDGIGSSVQQVVASKKVIGHGQVEKHATSHCWNQNTH